MYINPITLSNQSKPAPGLLELTPEQEEVYLQYNGFVAVEETEDGVVVTPRVEDWEAWKAAQPDPLEAARAAKIEEMSTACNAAIVAGLDIQLGEAVEHFNYNEKDQINIKEMFDAVIMGATQFPYQSEEGSCRVYTAAEILTIYPALAGNKTGQLTYYHQLKEYISTLETAGEIEAVTYGQPLTGAYLEHYTQMMAVAQEQMGLILAGGGSQ